jgi:hypothetical protein
MQSCTSRAQDNSCFDVICFQYVHRQNHEDTIFYNLTGVGIDSVDVFGRLVDD